MYIVLIKVKNVVLPKLYKMSAAVNPADTRPLPSANRELLAPSRVGAWPEWASRLYLSVWLPPSHLQRLFSNMWDVNVIQWPSHLLMLTSFLSFSNQIQGQHPRRVGSWHWHHGGVCHGNSDMTKHRIIYHPLPTPTVLLLELTLHCVGSMKLEYWPQRSWGIWIWRTIRDHSVSKSCFTPQRPAMQFSTRFL